MNMGALGDPEDQLENHKRASMWKPSWWQTRKWWKSMAREMSPHTFSQ
uniref:Alternative protein ADAMTS18 n=1 Tax=Homo sapiens TaxID=9606 RepID=L8ECP9_HUMAN|nr:alternative protein ADAMTS18 [Homo sapiens]